MSNYFDIFDIVLSLIKLLKFYSLLVSQSMNWKNLGPFVDFSYLLFLILHWLPVISFCTYYNFFVVSYCIINIITLEDSHVRLLYVAWCAVLTKYVSTCRSSLTTLSYCWWLIKLTSQWLWNFVCSSSIASRYFAVVANLLTSVFVPPPPLYGLQRDYVFRLSICLCICACIMGWRHSLS